MVRVGVFVMFSSYIRVKRIFLVRPAEKSYYKIMTLRRSTTLWVSLALLTFVFLTGVLSHHIISARFIELENAAINDDIKRLQEAIRDELNTRVQTVKDYGQWIDTWNYIFDRNKAYENANFTFETLKNLNVENFIFLDTLFHFQSHYGIDIYSEGDSTKLDTLLLKDIIASADELKLVNTDGYSWIAPSHGALFIIAASPITPETGSSERRGLMLMTRKVDSTIIKKFIDHVRLPVQYRILDKSTFSKIAKPITCDIIHRQGKPSVSVGLLHLENEPVVFSLQRERHIESSGKASITFLHASLLVVGLLLLSVLLVILQKVILKPLFTLGECFRQIGGSGNWQLRVPTDGPSEIRTHALSINEMLDCLGSTMSKLETSEKHQRLLTSELQNSHAYLTNLIDYFPDATFAVNAHGQIMAWNRSMELLTGECFENVNGKNIEQISILMYGVRRPILLESFFHPEYGNETFPERLTLSNGNFQFEEFVAKGNRSQGRFLNQTAVSMKNQQGEFVGAFQTIRDITDQKRAEMRLEFLSLHDTLSGLFNRAYYEEAVAGLSVSANLPLGVILIDLDGLKIVNDTLGHEHGDSLILAAAGLLRRQFPDQPVARIGGDEFVVLFVKTTEESILRGVDLLLKKVSEFNESNPPVPVQMSAGFAWSDIDPSITSLVKEADVRMYREKDLRRESVRTSYITSLKRRFEELHQKDENVTEQLVNLASRFGVFIGLSTEDLSRLTLLSQYRDIGKVGTPDRITNKPDTLDKSEEEELRKQPEIGYRIAKLSRELFPIADNILKHREWWDGCGYPLGIAGDQIPQINRILAVVESYVAMTSPRIRRRSLTNRDALEEIQLMAGKKLDPYLVREFSNFMDQNTIQSF
jgi:diguanylate cyclase (GGDEF)-like protein